LGHETVVREVTMPHQNFHHPILDQMPMLQDPPCWEIHWLLHLGNQIIKSDQYGPDSKTQTPPTIKWNKKKRTFLL
jgi:hypothetical protein